MFTGLIEARIAQSEPCPAGPDPDAFPSPEQHIGRISHITPTPTYVLTISDATKILDDCSIGDSIAVIGACLTVTDFDAQAGWFKIGLGGPQLACSLASRGSIPLQSDN